MITILGIESSCDETSAAIVQDGYVLSNIIADQEVHKHYGGVVPELASRAHQQNIVPVVHCAFDKAKIKKEQIDAVAFTRGPGLLGSLLVGASFAKSFAMGMKIPLMEVNHLHAHILAHFINETDPVRKQPGFPFLCLIVSGGHTQIVKVSDHLNIEIIGETLDDAAGEAFDKTAKILGLPYPGGPLIDKYAKMGNADAYQFPEPSIPGFDFSFSGLKTSILYFIQKELKNNSSFIRGNLYDICASVQQRIVSILLNKLQKASDLLNITEIAIAGGVSANTGLRRALNETGKKNNWNIYIPKLEYCTDNAAMIAITGHYKYLRREFSTQQVSPLARYTFNKSENAVCK